MKTKKLFAIIAVAIATTFFTCEQVPDYCSDHNPLESGQFCFGGKAHNKCANGETYNPQTEGCHKATGEAGTLCADNSVVEHGTLCGPHTLSYAIAPANGGRVEVVGDYLNAIDDTRYEFKAEDHVTLVAHDSVGFTFIGWAGTVANSSTDIDLNLTMQRNTSVIAMFRPTANELITDVFPANSGTISSDTSGATITVTATANDGFVFDGWVGADTSKEATIEVTMDGGKTLVAIFKPVVYDLRVFAQPFEGGAVFVNGTAFNDTVSENIGTEVELLARASAGFVFSHWSDSASGTNNPITINLTNGNKKITANFVRGSGGGGDDGGDIVQNVTYFCPFSDSPCVIQQSGASIPENCYATQDACLALHGLRGSCTWGGECRESVLQINCNGDFVVNGVCSTADDWEIIEGSFIDSRDQQTYRTVEMPDGKIWMAQNLNYETDSGSWCYNNNFSGCNTYGRLYDWATAMGFESSCNTSSCADQIEIRHHRGICPEGWHLPSDAEWNAMLTAVDGLYHYTPATKLKSSSGWEPHFGTPVGADNFGFSALPGGRLEGSFGNVGYSGYWWTSTEDGEGYAKGKNMNYNYETVFSLGTGKSDGFSVRCVMD